MERNAEPPQKQVLLLEGPPVYKSSLVYRPSDYYNATHRRGIYYDEDDDVEAQADDEKAMLEGAASVRKARRKRSGALCCCTICYVVFILLFVAAILLVKLVPKEPAVKLGVVNITEFVYNQTTNGDQQLTASLTFDLNVTSRNRRADTIYKEVNLSLFFQDQSLGDFKVTPQPQFQQKNRQTTSVVTDLAAGEPTTIENKSTANNLKNQAASNNVQVDLRGAVKGKLKVIGINVKKFDIEIQCVLNVRPGSGQSQASVIGLTCYYYN